MLVRGQARASLVAVIGVIMSTTFPVLTGAWTAAAVDVRPLPVGVGWDYQIGGVRAPAAGVGIVVRDASREPAGVYDICYLNAFQTQPDQMRFWRHPARRHLVLRDSAGRPVVDGEWGEALLDVRTYSNRRQIGRIVGRWTRGCANRGYEAVEFDNLDAWTRSDGHLTRRQTVAMARLLVDDAHRAGLAVAQKNTPQLRAAGPRIGFDFVIAEECGRWNECGAYMRYHGRRVLVVEYRHVDFGTACARWGPRLPIVLRDYNVTAGGPDRRC